MNISHASLLPLDARREKTQARIADVECLLQTHQANMKLLKDMDAGRISLKGKRYTRGAENYQPTPIDKQRLPKTLKNLNNQCLLLECELKTLMEYGL